MSQLSLFVPDRKANELPGVAISPLIDGLLRKVQPVAIGVSGGKDSGAAAWATRTYLDEHQYLGERLLIHADLGRIEWADSLPTCERLAERLGIELVTVQRAAGGMVERWMTRWDNNVKRYADLSCVKLILPWSTPSMRFCTSELKTAIICRELIRRFPNKDIVSVSGIRRQESSGRAKKPVYSEQPRLQSNKWDTDGFDWNPIIDWTLDDVWNCHKWHDLPVHEAYITYKSSRVSCSFCIMSSLSDLVKSATCTGNQNVYRELVDLEITSTFGFQDNQWLADVAPHLLTEQQREGLVKSKISANLRALAERRIPDHLLYEKGWPNAMPTYPEAVMLAEVRKEVSEAVGIGVWMKEPETILMRYEELMRLKESKRL